MGFGAQFNIYILNATENADGKTLWRRRRDSNPRDPFRSNGFQDRRFQPLTHSSVSNYILLLDLAGVLVTFLPAIPAFWCRVSPNRCFWEQRTNRKGPIREKMP